MSLIFFLSFNSNAVAVGITQFSSSVKQEKGVAIKVLHSYKDQLWAQGGLGLLPQSPNEHARLMTLWENVEIKMITDDKLDDSYKLSANTDIKSVSQDKGLSLINSVHEEKTSSEPFDSVIEANSESKQKLVESNPLLVSPEHRCKEQSDENCLQSMDDLVLKYVIIIIFFPIDVMGSSFLFCQHHKTESI